MSVEAGIKRYRLVERIAQGAFGAVWRAADRVPGKELAVRVVSSSTASQEALAAFEAEMMSATSLRHRALARVYEVGRTSDAGVWTASEFVVGDSLEDVLAEKGPLSPKTALGLFSELALAVAELHGHGLAHGSISAQTVLLPRSKAAAMRPKLIGVGRARLLPRERRAASPPEGPYSSPEMVASRQYSAASDIWALGVLLFHCVMGRPPFAARTTTSFVADRRALRRILDRIDDEIVRGLVEQCLALAPADRPTATALVKQAELAGWLEEHDVDAASAIAEASPALPAVVAPIESPPVTAPAPPEPPRAIVQPVAIGPESTNDPAEPVVDFRPRRHGAKAVALIVAAAAAIALLVATSRPTRRPVARVVPDEAATSVSTAVPSTAASSAATAIVAPAVSASVPPPTPAVVESTVKPVAANAPPSPRKPQQDDNPYE